MTASKASKQGEAVRKWFLAAVATNMMKAQALTDWQPDPVQRQWLAALADRVQRYMTPRRQRLDLYNNHDYWSCWAVMATGLVLNDPDRLAWAGARVLVGYRADHAVSGWGGAAFTKPPEASVRRSTMRLP